MLDWNACAYAGELAVMPAQVAALNPINQPYQDRPVKCCATPVSQHVVIDGSGADTPGQI